MGGLNVGGKRSGVRNAEFGEEFGGEFGCGFGRCDLGGRPGMREAAGNYGGSRQGGREVSVGRSRESLRWCGRKIGRVKPWRGWTGWRGVMGLGITGRERAVS